MCIILHLSVTNLVHQYHETLLQTPTAIYHFPYLNNISVNFATSGLSSPPSVFQNVFKLNTRGSEKAVGSLVMNSCQCKTGQYSLTICFLIFNFLLLRGLYLLSYDTSISLRAFDEGHA